MRVLKVTVEDDSANLLKKLLQEVSFVKNVEEESTTANFQEPESPYERLKKIQQEIGDKDLFKDIEDPSTWQREIRKEWDRDLAISNSNL